MKTFIAVIILTFLLVQQNFLFAQLQFRLNAPKSEMTLIGTSSLHDWISVVESMEGQAEIISTYNRIENISALKVVIPVKSIKSGKSAMDNNTYKALKEPEFKSIMFNLKSIETNSNSLHYEGNLTVAGQTREIEGVVNYTYSSNDEFIFKGEIKMKMTDYGIEPPTAVFGTIKTGNEITLKYNLNYNKL